MNGDDGVDYFTASDNVKANEAEFTKTKQDCINHMTKTKDNIEKLINSSGRAGDPVGKALLLLTEMVSIQLTVLYELEQKKENPKDLEAIREKIKKDLQSQEQAIREQGS
jgi:hypothetical protein